MSSHKNFDLTINLPSDIKNVNSVVTDVIVILDESGSMCEMGNEPIQAANVFIDEQKINSENDDATFTLVTFNNKVKTVIDRQMLSDVEPLKENEYGPCGGTALNDAVCSTIQTEKGGNPKVVVIITDGMENSSQHFKTVELRDMIADAEKNHDWKFVFLGANINAFNEGTNISINLNRCAQFDQNIPGDLITLSRQTSTNVNNFRRSRTEGYINDDLVLPPRMKTSYSCQDDQKEKNMENNIGILPDRPLVLRRANADMPPKFEHRSPYQSPTRSSPTYFF